MGIIDRKKQELKNNAKKKIIKIIKPLLINTMIFLLIAAILFVIVTAVADKMKDLLNVAAAFVSNIWKWITDDYWIDLTKEIDVAYTDSDGNSYSESRTLMDQYMYRLDELGISLKDLRLLGDADYSDPNLLENPENKAKVQKYLKSFIVADLITSQIHRRNSSDLVCKTSNITIGENGEQTIEHYPDILSDKIDGGIFLYRTKDVTSVEDLSNAQNTNNSQTNTNTNTNTNGKTINTSSYGLNAENVQISMDNIKNEYKIAWVSDLHMMQPDESTINNDWYASHSTTFEQRNNGFNNSYAILPKIIECLNGNDFDAIVFGGDIMDNYSSDNFNYLKEQINKLTNKNIMFLVADHDYLTEMTTNDSTNKAAASLGVSGEIKNITIGKDGDSISLVGQNYSNEVISDGAINTIGNYLNTSTNSLFFTHVPVESKTQASAMQQWCRSVHNDQVYYWSSAASSKGYTNPPSNYLNTLYNSSSLKGVFAGHVHASGDFELNTGIKEHIFNASFRSSIGVITISPSGTVSEETTPTEQEQTTQNPQNGTETSDNLANCYRMEYLELENFRERVEAFNSSITGTGRGDIEKYFTIDEDGNLLIAQVDGYLETEKIQKGLFDESQYEGESSYTATIKKIDYKKEVSQYTLPYEFLVDLCMVTQNPEFVYHVAEMSLNTNISLLIQNNETTVVDEEVQKGTLVKQKKSKSGNISETGKEDYTRTKTRVTTTTNPILKVKNINTWSTYKKIEWRDRVLQKEDTNQLPGTYSDTPGGWTHVPEYKPNAIDDPSGTKQGHDEYWEREYFRDYTITKTHTTVTNNYYSIEGNLIRKSDNFLGLLRNKTGQYIEGTTPKFDIVGCKFDRNGINVSYKIPGRSIYEDPLSKLRSGEKMLYSTLKQNERTEPLVELMQYYMTFPEQEYYDLTGQEIEDILGGYSENYGNVQYDKIAEDEKEILYKICEAEAGGSSEEEIGHVASVILNRVKCSQWPNTIEGVVFQTNQFQPTRNGAYEKANPSDKTKRAVNNILANGDTTGGAVYFRTEKSAKEAGMPTSANETHKTYIFLFKDPNTHVFLTSQKALSELKSSAASTTQPAKGKLKDVFPDGIPTTREGMQKYLKQIEVPITTKNGQKTTTKVTVHKDIADDLKKALKEAQDAGFKVYEVQGFSWRSISGSSTRSQHSYGLAVDINVNENYCVYSNGKVDAGSFWKPGTNEYSIPKNGALYNAFKSIGWGWGGDWKNKKDYMHFSYTGG